MILASFQSLIQNNIHIKRTVARKPEDSFLETKTKDIYVDWFENEEEAKGKIKEALNA